MFSIAPSPGPSRVVKTKPKISASKRNCWPAEKERAEHIMLVDLGRNDLGRVCDYGSVKWNSS